MIALSCGIKISAVRHLVLSQSMRVTVRRTDRQNYDSQDRPRICSREVTTITTVIFILSDVAVMVLVTVIMFLN